MSKRKLVLLLTIFLLTVSLLLILFSLNINTYATSIEIPFITQNDFINGTYNNTYYNTTSNSISINDTSKNGSYISEIIDMNEIITWNDISWASNLIEGVLDLMEYNNDINTQVAYQTNSININWTDITPTMTSATLPSGSVTESDAQSAGYGAWALFDNTPSSGGWLTNVARSLPQWFIYDFGSGISHVAVGYSITPITGYEPTSWEFLGSNDNSIWIVLDSKVNYAWFDTTTNYFSFRNNESYRYFKFNMTKAESTNQFQISQFEIFTGNTSEDLQVYSEDTIKTQGSYSLKGIAIEDVSENETIIKNLTIPINLSNVDIIEFDVRSSRTGVNLQIMITEDESIENATGGTISLERSYVLHTFTSNGTFNSSFNRKVDLLVVGGAGGGGSTGGGGGGGGGFVEIIDYNLNSGSHIVEIGTGGVGASSTTCWTGSGSRSGTNSVFDSGNNSYMITGIGGGAGAEGLSWATGRSGGSGGGGMTDGVTVFSGGASTQQSSFGPYINVGYGNAGSIATTSKGGGGGGAGWAGTTNTGGGAKSSKVAGGLYSGGGYPTIPSDYSSSNNGYGGGGSGTLSCTTSGGGGGNGVIAIRYLSNPVRITHNINITTANVFQTESINISAIPNLHKDRISKIIIKVLNDDANNTFYIDRLIYGTNLNQDLNFSIRTCNDALCSGEPWEDISDIPPQPVPEAIKENQYFQYKTNFNILEGFLSPQLYTCTVSYQKPVINIERIYPTNNIQIGQNKTFRIDLNVSCSIKNCESINVTLDPITSWWDTNWKYRQEIIINKTYIDGDLTNFPVYVDLSDFNSLFFNNLTTSCGDIRITDNQSNEIPREIVSCNKAANTGELHFKGNLSSTDNTNFYIYYGNTGAINYADTDTFGAHNVWSEYVFVMHLDESSGTVAKESTSNSNNGTYEDSLPTQITGQVGEFAQEFDGTADNIALGSTVTISSGSEFTLSYWYYQRSVNRMTFGTKGTSTNYLYHLNSAGGFRWMDSTAANEMTLAMGYNSWRHFNMRKSGTTMYLYDDTTFSSSYVGPGTTSINDIGNVHTGGYVWDGYLDEMRISMSDLGVDWLKAEYENQKNLSTFYSLGELTFAGASFKDTISTIQGATPFYTNKSSNPYTISLNQNESQIVTFWVNATGDINTTYDFFAYTTLLSDTNYIIESTHWNVTILNETPADANINISFNPIKPTKNNNFSINVHVNLTNGANLTNTPINVYFNGTQIIGNITSNLNNLSNSSKWRHEDSLLGTNFTINTIRLLEQNTILGIQTNPGYSCNDIYDADPSSTNGNYWIDPDGAGGIDAFEVYCLMETSYNSLNGWTLVSANRQNTVASTTQTTILNTADSNKAITDARWGTIRTTSDYMLSLLTTTWQIDNMANMRAASCVALANSLTAAKLAHSETVGCTISGSDYCMLGNLVTTRNVHYTLCTNTPFTIAGNAAAYWAPSTMNLYTYGGSTTIVGDGGYPTSKSYYSYSTSLIDTSKWNGIQNITLNDNTPTQTSIKYLVSFDNNVTWKSYNSTTKTWSNSALSNIGIDGMSKVTLESINRTEWTKVFVGGTFDIALDLNTSNNSLTPEFFGFNLTGAITKTDSDGNFNFSTTAPNNNGIYPITVNLTYNKRFFTATTNLTLNDDQTESFSIKYICPTPDNNSKYSLNPLIVKINDTTSSLTWANITIDGTEYVMINNGDNTWQYNYINTPKTITNITFQVTSSLGDLDERTFTYYPDFTTGAVPYANISSYILTIIILIIGEFILN